MRPAAGIGTVGSSIQIARLVACVKLSAEPQPCAGIASSGSVTETLSGGSMGPAQLIRWQREGYLRYHGARGNLIIHIFAVALFLAGNLMLVTALLSASAAWSAISIAYMVVSIAAQGRFVSKLEKISPEPIHGDRQRGGTHISRTMGHVPGLYCTSTGRWSGIFPRSACPGTLVAAGPRQTYPAIAGQNRALDLTIRSLAPDICLRRIERASGIRCCPVASD